MYAASTVGVVRATVIVIVIVVIFTPAQRFGCTGFVGICPTRPQRSTISSAAVSRGPDVNVRIWQASETMLPSQILHKRTRNESVVQRRKPDPRWAETMIEDEKSRQTRRQKSEAAAQQRARTPVDASTDLRVLYADSSICVTDKPSGLLTVPGIRRNPSLAQLVYDTFVVGVESNDRSDDRSNDIVTSVDQMVVHRLDMDTSGIVVFALTISSLRRLHFDFRSTTTTGATADCDHIHLPTRKIYKSYQALLVGHVLPSSPLSSTTHEIDIALERDPENPPFMRVAQPREITAANVTTAAGFQKYLSKAPKPSLTEMTVISLEYLQLPNQTNGAELETSKFPVTRVNFVPRTGRTHQLRVHAAAIGHPIVGDDIYGCDQTLSISLCLHARTLSLYHPLTGAPMMFTSEPPF